jgi:hypothetical protein
MSFDAWVVAFAISKLLHDLHMVAGSSAYLALGGVIVVDGWLLYRFFAVGPPARDHVVAS